MLSKPIMTSCWKVAYLLQTYLKNTSSTNGFMKWTQFAFAPPRTSLLCISIVNHCASSAFVANGASHSAQREEYAREIRQAEASLGLSHKNTCRSSFLPFFSPSLSVPRQA